MLSASTSKAAESEGIPDDDEELVSPVSIVSASMCVLRCLYRRNALPAAVELSPCHFCQRQMGQTVSNRAASFLVLQVTS